MRHLVIEPHYLGSIEFYACLMQADLVTLEVCQHFTKQTYKNRCQILTPTGVSSLSVPVRYDNRTAYKDVTIDYDQSWLRAHLGAFDAAYGKSPFFEFFEDAYRSVWMKKTKFLLDLNLQMMTICLKVLQIDRDLQMTESYQKNLDPGLEDVRECILPKKPFQDRSFYQVVPYTQVFGSNFVPALSILDAIMCEGTNARSIVQKSILNSR